MAMVKQQVFIPQNLKMSPKQHAFRSLNKNGSGVLPKIQPFPSWNVASYHVEFSFLGGGNSNIFGIFTPKIGEDEPLLTSIFFRWVGSTTNQVSNHPNQNVFHPFSVVDLWSLVEWSNIEPSKGPNIRSGRLRNKSRIPLVSFFVFSNHLGVDVSKTHARFCSKLVIFLF